MFEWDNHQDNDSNGKHLIIGQHLPKRQNQELTHLHVAGISLDCADTSKDIQTKSLSPSQINVSSMVASVTKEQARTRLYEEIDKALDIMFDEGNQRDIENMLNIDQPETE